jgi:uncharacterized protein (DUF983 family)
MELVSGLLAGLFMGWGAIVLAVLMALTVALKWPKWLHYVWAVMVLVSGILSLN